MNEDEARKFAEILRAEILRENPEVAAQMRRMQRGIRSPSRIIVREESRRDSA